MAQPEVVRASTVIEANVAAPTTYPTLTRLRSATPIHNAPTVPAVDHM